MSLNKKIISEITVKSIRPTTKRARVQQMVGTRKRMAVREPDPYNPLAKRPTLDPGSQSELTPKQRLNLFLKGNKQFGQSDSRFAPGGSKFRKPLDSVAPRNPFDVLQGKGKISSRTAKTAKRIFTDPFKRKSDAYEFDPAVVRAAGRLRAPAIKPKPAPEGPKLTDPKPAPTPKPKPDPGPGFGAGIGDAPFGSGIDKPGQPKPRQKQLPAVRQSSEIDRFRARQAITPEVLPAQKRLPGPSIEKQKKVIDVKGKVVQPKPAQITAPAKKPTAPRGNPFVTGGQGQSRTKSKRSRSGGRGFYKKGGGQVGLRTNSTKHLNRLHKLISEQLKKNLF
jgi:hypothetical protein